MHVHRTDTHPTPNNIHAQLLNLLIKLQQPLILVAPAHKAQWAKY